MKITLPLFLNVAILGLSVSVLWLALNHGTEAMSMISCLTRSLAACPVVATILGATNNIIGQLRK